MNTNISLLALCIQQEVVVNHPYITDENFPTDSDFHLERSYKWKLSLDILHTEELFEEMKLSSLKPATIFDLVIQSIKDGKWIALGSPCQFPEGTFYPCLFFNEELGKKVIDLVADPESWRDGYCFIAYA